MLRSGKVLIVIVLAFGLLGVSALAQAPPTLMYQGKLTDANLDPITTATEVTFRIWDAQDESGVELWAEIQSVTPNAQGVFTIELGAVTPFPAGLLDGSVRFLSMTVTGDDEMLPRQPITSVPYAMAANAPGFANTHINYWSIGSAATLVLMDSVTINVPGPGYIIVDVSGYLYSYKAASQYSYGYVTLDTLRGSTDGMAYGYTAVDFDLPDGGYYDNIAPIRVHFADAAGSYRFYLHGYGYGSSWSLNIANLRATYYPAYYGGEHGSPVPPKAAAPGQAPPVTLEEMIRRDMSEDQK